jgi:hypothetical protein
MRLPSRGWNKRNIVKHSNTDENLRYPGKRKDKPFTVGVAYWFKQDEKHQATHARGGPAFLPWHRELYNRFKKLLENMMIVQRCITVIEIQILMLQQTCVVA